MRPIMVVVVVMVVMTGGREREVEKKRIDGFNFPTTHAFFSTSQWWSFFSGRVHCLALPGMVEIYTYP
jgi:hypothetical protein